MLLPAPECVGSCVSHLGLSREPTLLCLHCCRPDWANTVPTHCRGYLGGWGTPDPPCGPPFSAMGSTLYWMLCLSCTLAGALLGLPGLPSLARWASLLMHCSAVLEKHDGPTQGWFFTHSSAASISCRTPGLTLSLMASTCTGDRVHSPLTLQTLAHCAAPLFAPGILTTSINCVHIFSVCFEQAVAAIGLFVVLGRRYSISFRGKQALQSAAKFLGPTGTAVTILYWSYKRCCLCVVRPLS